MSAAAETMSVMQTALQLAEEHSLPVFPCRPDKRPYVEHGFKDASCNIEQIDAWWTEYPDALIGVPTGRASGIMAIDIDPSGEQWYRGNAARLSCGRIHRTRRGWHLIYSMPQTEVRNSASKLAPGIDVRAEGGYIIWWPAHGLPATGDMLDIGPSPEWLLQLLTEGRDRGDDHHGADDEHQHDQHNGQIPEGQRNAYLSKEAFRLRKLGTTVAQILIVLRALNTARCSPPLADDELQQIAQGKGRVEPDSPGPSPPRRSWIDWAALEGHSPPPREWIVPYWFPDHHVTLMAGRAGIGKTLLAQHIASAVALGLEYIELIQSKPVLMWAGEDDKAELWRRQIEISAYLGQPLSALAQKLYLCSYVGADMTLASVTYGELQPTPLMMALKEQAADIKAGLVVIDNIARVFGGNENDRHAVTTFCAWLQGACAPAAVLLLGHPAKAAGSEFSGSTAWEGAVRARLYLSDRPPDQDAQDDAPMDDRVRYLARRKANYSALDIRRLTLREGVVLVPETIEPTRANRPTGEFLYDIVRRAVTKLAERDMYGTNSTASPDYLPKLAERYGLLETATKKMFTKAMREMVMAGTLKSAPVAKYANHTDKLGLVLS